jgi:hypothetical protein
MAATSMKDAGKVALEKHRETVMRPSSRGWRRSSSTFRRNSGSSSRKRTP